MLARLNGAVQRVGQFVGGLAAFARVDHDVAEAAQVFKKDMAQERGQRPQFRNRQRDPRLHAIDEFRQRRDMHVRIRHRDVSPGERIDAFDRAPFGSFDQWQVAQEARPQSLALQAESLVDDMLVVDQPFGCRGDDMPLARGLQRRQVIAPDRLAIVAQPRAEIDGNQIGRGFQRIGRDSGSGLAQALSGPSIGAQRLPRRVVAKVATHSGR